MEIKTIVVGALGANCYLATDEATRAAVIIDPGDDPKEIERVVCDSEVDLKHILLTHGHPDHSFSAGELQQRFHGVETLMHEADVPQLTGVHDIVAMYYDTDRYIRPVLGRFLTDEDIIQIGETRFTVIHTPGHTAGGLSFVSGSVAFTGDTLFAGGVGRTDLPSGSYEDLMRSIKNKLLTLPEDTVIYPGHGPASTIGDEKESNPWL